MLVPKRKFCQFYKKILTLITKIRNFIDFTKILTLIPKIEDFIKEAICKNRRWTHMDDEN